MAKAKVDMLLGVYEWPDGRSKMLPDGRPRTSNPELLRVGGYSDQYRKPTILYNDPYFVSQVNLELARREKRSALVPYQPGRMRRVRDLLADELEARLINSPEAFSPALLLKSLAEYQTLMKDEEKHEGSGPPKKDLAQQFNTFVNQTLNVMSADDQDSLVTTAAAAADSRIDALQKAIDQVNAQEEDADELDVIDAEIDSESD